VIAADKVLTWAAAIWKDASTALKWGLAILTATLLVIIIVVSLHSLETVIASRYTVKVKTGSGGSFELTPPSDPPLGPTAAWSRSTAD
jgi:hypothetical protein